MLRNVVKLAAIVLVPAFFALDFSCKSNNDSCVNDTCQGGMASALNGSEAACASCIESQCGSQLSAVCSDCASELACEQACKCTDDACLTSCGQSVSSACAAALSAGTSCSNMNCASECNGTSGTSSSSSSSGTTGGSGLSCDDAAAFICVTYPAGASPSSCPQGTSVSACSSANALGTCTITDDGLSESETYYSGGSFTASTAASECTGVDGTWVAN